MTLNQRIAIAENARLIGLLLDSGVPNSKDLAAIVFARIAGIGQNAPVDEASDAEAGEWVRVALLNTTEIMAYASGKESPKSQ